PTIKWSLGWFEMDFTGKIGVTQIAGPKLYYDKLYFGEAYDVYRFTKEGQDWSVAWSAGARAIFKVNSWMGIQAKVDYWDTQIFDRALYSYTYKDVIDLDSNGQLDDEEFFTSTTVSRRGATDVRTLNLNLGLIFQFGNTTKRPNEVIDQAMVSEMKVEKESDQANIDEGQNKIGDDAVITQEKNVDPSLEMAIRDSSILSEMPTSVIHGDEDIDKKEGRDTDSMGLASQEDQALLEELEKQRLDSLYDAGEYFFSTQQYRQAADHFNQALDHPDYPRSRYMYALSLSFSGDCEQAKREFKQFKKEYTGSDLRSLEVLFVSQFENCTSISKNNQGSEGIQQKDVIVINKDEKRKTDHLTITETNKAGIKSTVDIDSSAIHPVLKKEYQVQFIAIGHTDAIFKEMAKLGKINIEYIKDKKLYRYSLTGFERLEDALPLLKRVRGLGFSDAFIALYQDGVRKETMFHDEISKD
ncbi:MAG: tetratricopeptide repeat protein, partial [Chitinophagales bacterium]|nr:tetratricopeptide repeat protein [Chitinophagales bacterium]